MAHLASTCATASAQSSSWRLTATAVCIVFAENIPASGGRAGAFVARYSPAGALEGIYELPLTNVPLSRRFVAVSVNGDVYFLRTQSGGVEILGLGFRPSKTKK